MPSWPLITYILRAALRDKIVLCFLTAIVPVAGLAIVLGASAVSEQADFSIVFLAAFLRILGVVSLSVFFCAYLRRSFENREVEFLLARPLSRLSFLTSHMAAFSVLAVTMVLVLGAAIGLAGTIASGGLLSWTVGLAVEYLVLSAIALFFALGLSSVTGAVLATLAFYVLARMMGVLLGIAAQAPDNYFLATLGRVMDVLAVIVPRLDLICQGDWLTYGPQMAQAIAGNSPGGTGIFQAVLSYAGPLSLACLQGGCFVLLAVGAAALDFSRRQF